MLKRSTLTLAALLIAGIAAGPPAQAASIVDGNWDAGICGGFSVRVDNNVAFVQMYRADGSWAFASGALASGVLNATSNIAMNGQTIGGAYRLPTISAGPGMQINFVANTYRPNPDLECAITQTEFFSGGLIAGSVYNSPFTGPYVSHIRSSANTFGPDENGTGFFVQMQGATLDLKVAGYDASGNPRWYSMRGSCVMTANHICHLAAPLMAGQSGVSLGTGIYELRNNGGALVIYPGETFDPEPQRWLARFGY